MSNQRYHHHHPHFPPGPPHRPGGKLYYVSLKVGTREFIGQGLSRQLARHQAATKAILCLRQLPDSQDAAVAAAASATENKIPAPTPQDQQSQIQSSNSENPDASSLTMTTTIGSVRADALLDEFGAPSFPSASDASSGALSGTLSGDLSGALSASSKEDSFIDPVLRSMQDLTVEEEEGKEDAESPDLKSEISLVHEITLKVASEGIPSHC